MRTRKPGVYVTVDIEGHVWTHTTPCAVRTTARESCAWGLTFQEAYTVALRRLQYRRRG